MGMILPKHEFFSLLNKRRYPPHRADEARNALAPFRLFGFILHDPVAHPEFHHVLSESFERLDYLTGEHFLFFTVIEPNDNWLKRASGRGYYTVFNSNPLLSVGQGVVPKDFEISIFTLAEGLGIDYADLPVLVLTNDLQGDTYQVIKTSPQALEKQLTEIGYFCSQQEEKFNILNGPFQDLVKSIDIAGESYLQRVEDSMADMLGDFLSFLDSSEGGKYSPPKALRYGRVVEKYLMKGGDDLYDQRREQLKLFVLGCLSHLSPVKIDPADELDIRCEAESRIIYRTYLKVYPVFEDLIYRAYLKSRPQRPPHRLDQEQEGPRHFVPNANTVDLSPLFLCLGKVLEIEVNHSLVQWYRQHLKIEMPTFYNLYKPGGNSYTVIPNSGFENPRPIDLNKRLGQNKWKALNLGESQLVAKTLYADSHYPEAFTDFNTLLIHWELLMNFRNQSAHTNTMGPDRFTRAQEAFQHILQNHLELMLDLKEMLKPPMLVKG
jgi:hypothetical protein